MVVVAAVAIVCLLLLPHLVAKRTAITHSREIDRFSPQMRVLRTEDGKNRGPEDGCRTPERRLLAATDGQRAPGGTMSSHIEDGRRPVVGARALHRENARIREIAQLRARRAARLANERAAGQRRLLAAALTALATVVVVVLAQTSVVTWMWVAVPAGLLVASLVTSRLAAMRSEASGRAEDERLHQLREGLGVRKPARQESRTTPVSGSSVSTPHGETATDTVPEETAPSGGVAPGESHTSPASPQSDQDVYQPTPGEDGADSTDPLSTRGGISPDVAGAGQEHEHDQGAQHGTARTQGRAWSVAPLPSPSYAVRPRVVGREVHADTDLRGIPLAGASVPARPKAEDRTPRDARSTDEVVASQPVVFDLDAVLDNRRAQ